MILLAQGLLRFHFRERWRVLARHG